MKTSTFIPFTDEQKQRAASVDLEAFLQSRGEKLIASGKGSFIVMKTGSHPMKTELRLFLKWGISFEEPYTVPERIKRQVAYANYVELQNNIVQRYSVEGDKSDRNNSNSPRVVLPQNNSSQTDGDEQVKPEPLTCKT